MTWLSLLLIFKITVTALTASGPMLLLPAAQVVKHMGVGVEAIPFVRLYGMALTALLVGYASGIPAAENGAFPMGVVWMGIVSNGGATLLLLLTGAYRKAPLAVPVFGAITVGLVCAMLAPSMAITHAL